MSSLFSSASVIGFFLLLISSADTTNAKISELRQKILDEHNKYRGRHQVPPLKLNNQLNQYAQEWADELLITRLLKHRPQSHLGENLWAGSGITLNDLMTNESFDPVATWYKEVEYYPSGSFSQWGHFTQVIWKESKYMGVGIANAPDIIYVVCNYDPAGNFADKYEENVFPEGGRSSMVAEEEEPPAGGKFWLYAFIVIIVILVVAAVVFFVVRKS